MKNIFLDTNVIIDFLTNRLPFSIDAAQLFELSKRGHIKIYISSLSINNINYIVGRLETKQKALKVIEQLLPLVEILPITRSVIEKTLLSNFKDFEDGLQNFCALENKLKIIVTRDIKDYRTSELSIYTPFEYLQN